MIGCCVTLCTTFQDELAAFGESTNGKKSELVARLTLSLLEDDVANEELPLKDKDREDLPATEFGVLDVMEEWNGKQVFGICFSCRIHFFVSV